MTTKEQHTTQLTGHEEQSSANLRKILTIKDVAAVKWKKLSTFYRVKSVLRAPVPAYCLEQASALSAHAVTETSNVHYDL